MSYLNLYLGSMKYLWLVVYFSLVSCATQSADQYLRPLDTGKYKTLRIEPCIDRTGLSGARNIAAEATESLREKITKSDLFEVNQNGELMITCDVVRFVEGSAIKRWIWPGWGATKAKITAMVWERSNQTVLAIFSSVAKVEAGGLYTIGADQYIIGVAVNDVVEKLTNWVQGKRK
jgi:hypothetical protein